MYHNASISPLSSTQISKILNGHSVRVSAGNGHNVELSKEQFKKLSKAHNAGKAITLTMDPFQIQNHQYLRGSGNVKKTAKGSVKRLIVSGTDRAIRAMEGSSVNRLKKGQRWEQFANATLRDGIDTAGKAARVYYDSTNPAAQMGYGIGGNIKAVAKDAGKRLIVAGTDRAIRAMEGSSINRLKKGQRWEQFANATLRDGIDTAGKAARVYYDSTDPASQMGFGLKKRGRPKRGGALFVAGTP
jgi:hypothetical protein